MNEEKIRQQLARYGSSAKPADVEEPGSESKSGDPFGPLPKDWVAPPRYQTEYKRPDPAKFQPGEIDTEPSYGGRYQRPERMAIPYPAWPSPGQLVTPELDRTFSEEQNLWLQSKLLLEDVIAHTWYKLCRDDPDSPIAASWYDERLTAQRWNFLLGLWQGRGMTPPTEKQLESWAREWANWKPKEPAIT